MTENPHTTAMFDILFDTIAYEPGGNYFGFENGFTNYFYVLPNLAIHGKTTDFASWHKKYEKQANMALGKFYTSLDEVESKG